MDQVLILYRKSRGSHVSGGLRSTLNVSDRCRFFTASFLWDCHETDAPGAVSTAVASHPAQTSCLRPCAPGMSSRLKRSISQVVIDKPVPFSRTR